MRLAEMSPRITNFQVKRALVPFLFGKEIRIKNGFLVYFS